MSNIAGLGEQEARELEDAWANPPPYLGCLFEQIAKMADVLAQFPDEADWDDLHWHEDLQLLIWWSGEIAFRWDGVWVDEWRRFQWRRPFTKQELGP